MAYTTSQLLAGLSAIGKGYGKQLPPDLAPKPVEIPTQVFPAGGGGATEEVLNAPVAGPPPKQNFASGMSTDFDYGNFADKPPVYVQAAPLSVIAAEEEMQANPGMTPEQAAAKTMPAAKCWTALRQTVGSEASAPMMPAAITATDGISMSARS